MKKTYSSSFILRNLPNSPQKSQKTPSSNLKPRLKRLSPIYSNVSFRIPQTIKLGSSGNSSVLNHTRRKLLNRSTPKSNVEEPMFTILPTISSISKIGHKRTMSSITTTDTNNSLIICQDVDKCHTNLNCRNELESIDFRDFNPMVTPTSDESRCSKISVYNQPYSKVLDIEKHCSVRKFQKIFKTSNKSLDTASSLKPFIYKTNVSTPLKALERNSTYSRNISYSKITLTSQKTHENSYAKLYARRLKSKSPEKTPEKPRKIYR